MTHPVRHTAFTFVLAFLAFLFAPGFNGSVHAQQQPAVTVTLTGPTEVNEDAGTWNYSLAATTEGATAPTVNVTVDFYELPASVTGHTAGSGDYTGPGGGGRRFVFAPSDFSIPSGETNQTATKTGTVTIIDDTDEEDDETFHIFLNGYYPNMMPDTVTVSNPSSSSPFIVTINDNDGETGGDAQSVTYRVTFEGKWTTSVTSGGVPSDAHFSPLIGAVHNDSVTFWSSGGTASAGVEAVAENGQTSLFKTEINASSNAVAVVEKSPSFGATDTVTVDFEVTRDHPLVTLLSMIAPSPDWFVGVSGLSLLNAQGEWLESHTVDLFPYDAGTEDGTEFQFQNPDTSPQGTIASLKGTGKFSTEPIASLTFTRQSVNTAPSFPATETGARSVAENTVAGQNIGLPVAASDAENDTLVYTLGGTDAASFDIVRSSGQLQTKAALDYETKSSYSVTVTATDSSRLSAEVAVTISVTDIANEMTASADATLSGLTLSEGRLSPVFPSGTTAYTASVGYTVSRITVTATTTDSGATVTFLDGNDAALADADGVTNGHQVDLEVGANVIKVKVTAEDGDTTRTYTVTVTREATVNICNRTAEVQTAILATTEVSASDCALVLASELALITSLQISGESLISLQDGDLAGLTGLTTLEIVDAPAFDTLPAGIFDELSGLTTLRIIDTLFGGHFLPTGIFDQLTSLETLELEENRLSNLPTGIFDRLTSLETLELDGNYLTSLGPDVFDPLTSLTTLDLCDNDLASLPPDVFDQLTGLTVLNLYFNPLTGLPSGVFDQLTQLQELRLYGTDLRELPSGVFDSLTNLRVLLLHRTLLDELPPNVFRSLTSLTDLKLRTTRTDHDDPDDRPFSYSPYQLSPLTSLRLLNAVPYAAPSVPGAPSGLAAGPALGTIELTWTAPTSGRAATSYQILRQAGGGTEEVYVEDTFYAGGAAVTYTDTDVTVGETYRYRVKALNAGGASAASVAASAVAASHVIPLPPPVPVVASVTSSATHPTKDSFTVTISFSEAVTGLTANEIAVTNGTGSNFAGTGASYTLDIEPSPNIEGDVTVRVPANAAVDGANLGNVEGSETFAVDTRSPVFQSATVVGAALTLTYGEALDGSSTPAPGDFTVNVESAGRTVSNVAIGGSTVTLTLDPAVEHGDTGITVSYRVPGTNPIRDAVGNDAGVLTNQGVTNNTADTKAPTVSSITSGATHPTKDPFTVTITFSEAVTGLTANEIAVTNGRGSNLTGTDARYALTVTPSPNIEDNVTIRVPANAALDAANLGNVEGSETFAVDTRAPELLSAAVNGADLVLNYGEALDGSSTPAAGDFTMAGGNAARTVSAVAVGGSAVTLTLNPAAEYGETGITVSYRPGTNPIQDAVGNDADGLTNQEVTNITPPPDRAVLVAFYNATDGANWTNNTNWLSNETLSEWYGVTTDANGRVTSLNLQQNGLSGEIPAELGSLTSLQSLSLWGNALSGEIPAELGSLTNLQFLYLHRNNLSGEIPTELGNLANLQWLSLYGNTLSGEIPVELGSLANLQALSLWGNTLSGEIPEELGSLTNLQFLYLHRNNLSGEIPTELGNLANLQELQLDWNTLSGEIPVELGNLANLQDLRLGWNDLSGAIPAELGGLANLQELSLSRNSQLTGPLPVDLRHLSHLVELWTSDTELCAPRDAAFQAWLTTLTFNGVNCPPESQSVIDVAVFYTSVARIAEGGTEPIEAEIDLMIAETNQAYVDSGVNQRLSLVAREEVEYTESDSIKTDLGRLRNAADGHMDTIHGVRDRVAADIVVLLVKKLPGICGEAYLMGNVSNSFEASAFSVIVADCGADSFAHETGHIMGLQHDRYVACDEGNCQNGAYAYSYGYVNQRAFDDGAPVSARWRTIMSYESQCDALGLSCIDLLRFSNPNQIHPDPGGDPMGVAGLQKSSEVTGPADAVRTLNRTRETVESFRRVLPVTVSFGAAAYTAAEDGNAATVTVRLSEAPGRPLVISLKSMGATGASDDDYSGVPSAVAFASTDTATTFDVTAFNDTDDDDGETVELAFGELLPSGVTLGSPDAATVTLADNDESMGPGPKDTTAPTVSSITSGATHPTKDAFTVTISFSEEVTGLTAGGIAVSNGRGSNFAGTGASYTLDIEPNANIEGDVTVRVPADAAVDGANLGNVQGSETFAVDTRAPVLQSATVVGAALTLTYGEALDGSSTPGPGDFTVNVESAGRTVSNVAIGGSTVTLTLDPAVEHGDTGITVSYRLGTNPIQDAVGNDAGVLTNQEVTNNHAAASGDNVLRRDGGALLLQ